MGSNFLSLAGSCDLCDRHCTRLSQNASAHHIHEVPGNRIPAPSAIGRMDKDGHGSPNIIRVGEASINGFLHQQLVARNAEAVQNASGGHIEDARVQLKGDRIHFYLAFAVHGRNMTFDVEGKLRSDNGLMKFDADAGRIGAMPIPRSVLQAALQKMIEVPDASQTMRIPAVVKDLRVENGMMVIQRQ